MKIRVLIGAVIVSVCSVSQLSAYIYSFSNHTNEPLMVGIKLSGINEPFEWKLVPAKSAGAGATVEFAWTALFHPKPSMNIWKAGFWLTDLRVRRPLKKLVRVASEDGEGFVTKEVFDLDAQGQIQFGPEAAVNIEFVESLGGGGLLQAAEGFADMLQGTASSIAGSLMAK